MKDQYKIVFSGTLKEGTDQGEFIEKFCRYFKVSDKQAQTLVNAGRKVVIKKNLSAEEGSKYLAVLEKLGMEVHLEAMEPIGLSLEPMETETETRARQPQAEPARPTCPKCGSQRLETGECLDCGIIIAKYVESGMGREIPPPDQDPYRVSDKTRNVEPEYHGELMPISVPAGHGWTWIADGFNLFRRNAFAWIGAFLVFIVLYFLLNAVPFVGPLATSLLSPVIGAGFMIGCLEQDQGGQFRVGHLFSGFQQNAGQLVLVGAIYLGATILVFVIAGLLTLGGAFTAALGGMDQLAAQDPEAAAAALDPNNLLLFFLVSMALLLPVVMTYWFAPSLVALEGLPALEAMKLSFQGCIKNMIPFLVYGFASTVLMFIAALPFFLGLFVLIPALTASIYAAYRDIYRGRMAEVRS